MPTTAALIGTYCGLKINTKAQVIDVFGNKINHLYAAGEIVGGVHGAAYMTGTAWGKAMSLGRWLLGTLPVSNIKNFVFRPSLLRGSFYLAALRL